MIKLNQEDIPSRKQVPAECLVRREVMGSLKWGWLALGLFILVTAMPGYTQSPLFGDELPPLVTEEEPLATDQPWGTAIPEIAPSEEVISLTMKEVDIAEVLRVMFRSAGLNFSMEPGVSGKVTVSLENVPFNAALRTVLEQVGATFVKEEGIYKISSEAVTATGGISSIGIPQTPKRLRVVEVRFTAAAEMARIFGGREAQSSYIYGGLEGSGSSSNRNTGTSRTGTSPNISRSSGTTSRSTTTRNTVGSGSGDYSFR